MRTAKLCGKGQFLQYYLVKEINNSESLRTPQGSISWAFFGILLHILIVAQEFMKNAVELAVESIDGGSHVSQWLIYFKLYTVRTTNFAFVYSAIFRVVRDHPKYLTVTLQN